MSLSSFPVRKGNGGLSIRSGSARGERIRAICKEESNMKKHWLAWLLAFCLTAALLPGQGPEAKADGASVWDGTAATEFAGGRGTQDKPYIIQTAQQLAYLAQTVNSGTDYSEQYISLQADLDLSRLPWTPIGNGSNAQFKGKFLGNAHTISNLYINQPSVNVRGLFSYCGGGSVVQNLRLTDISVTGNTNIGGITGYLRGGTIRNCNVSGSVSGTENVGGIAGGTNYISVSASVSRCINNASVLANQGYSGGIVGKNETLSSTISQCVNNGAVDSYGDYAGGISGFSGTISNCINTGNVGGNATDRVGGICGSNTSVMDTSVMNCANMGTVTSQGSVYGIGYSAENCYNTGMVSTTSTSRDVTACSVAYASSYRRNCYTLRYIAEELGESDGNGLTLLEEMNTPAFAATLNRNIDTQRYSTWLQDANVYGGLPYFEPRTVSGIAVTRAPKKTAYAAGDMFDPSQMTVTANCSDGSSYELSHNALTFFPNTPLAEGTSSVTVFYGTLTTTCAVTVSAQSVSAYEIESVEVKKTNGDALSMIPTDDFLATVAIRRVVGDDDGMVMLAAYTAAGQFRGLMYVRVDAPPDSTTYVTLPVENPHGDVASLRAFVISSLSDMRPLSVPVLYPAA